jgi:hypothetical protein
MLSIPGTKLRFQRSDKGGWEYSDNGGETWYFTFRTESEIRDMWPGIEGTVPDPEAKRDTELEVFGDTLDEPIPDDLAVMLIGDGTSG